MSTTRKPIATPSLDFIAGIFCAHGYFMWYGPSPRRRPMIVVKLPIDDVIILRHIRKRWKLPEKVYVNKNEKYAIILIRHAKTLENLVIPCLDSRLFGTKEKEYTKWRSAFYKVIYR